MAADRGPIEGGRRRVVRLPSFLLGVGLGGFVDGIVLHQILQWHHMLTDTGDHPADTVPGLEDNTLADGLFHAVTWVVVLVGTTLAVRAWQRGELAPPWRVHVGLLLAGWGAFNLVEGLVDHHLLSVHHVRDDVADPLWWDLGFLAFGALLVLVGWALARARARRGQGRMSAPSIAWNLACVSASSAAGSEPATTPTPANTRASWPSSSPDRMPTAQRPLPRASTQPTGPA